MTRKRIYIAGPMRGLHAFNFPAFDWAAHLLATAGYDTISPAQHDRENGFDPAGMTGTEDLGALGFDLKAALGWDLEQVAHADGVAVLDGWERSSGARAEVATAHALGIPVATVHEWLNSGRRAYITPETPRSDNKTTITVRTNDTWADEILATHRPAVKLVGLNGFARSGKDTAADHLVAAHGFTKMSMAGPLKAMLRTLDPILGDGAFDKAMLEYRKARVSDVLSRASEDELKASIYGDEYRRLLQRLGTDCIRAIDPDFWVKAMAKAVADSGAEHVVVPDCRFPNEAEWVRAQGGIVIEVTRPGVGPANGHASEQRLPRELVHHTVRNDGSIEDLHRKLRTIVYTNRED